MNMSFYTAAVGAREQQDRLNVYGNNIANINNYGFRAKLPSFSHLMTTQVRGIDQDWPRGYGARMEEAQTDFRQGALKGTDRKLDYAISGDGFFGLEDPSTGEISYTRDGSFTLSELKDEEQVDPQTGEPVSHWYLSDGLGRFVLGRDGRRIEVYNESDTVDSDFSGLPDLSDRIGVFDFVNHDGMRSLGDNRLIPVEKNGNPAFGTGKIQMGFLEVSNADLANEMSKVIEAQRSFQFALRMVSASDEVETTVNNLR